MTMFKGVDRLRKVYGFAAAAMTVTSFTAGAGGGLGVRFPCGMTTGKSVDWHFGDTFEMPALGAVMLRLRP